MNKQEVISKLKSAIPKNNIDDYQRGEAAGLNFALLSLSELDDPEKPVVPKFVADWYEERKDYFDFNIYGFYKYFYSQGKHEEVKKWLDNAENKAIETLVKMKLYGYEVEKGKLYRAKNKQTGEYLCYCFEFFHDKNNSSENQRFTAEEKRWKELGYWGNDLYVFEEAEGGDE